MVSKHARNLLCNQLYVKVKSSSLGNIRCLFHTLREPQVENLPSKWYHKEYPMLLKLTHLLKDLDIIDGKLVNIDDYKTVVDENLVSHMHTFKSLVRTYIGYPLVQLSMKNNMTSGVEELPLLFNKPSERQPLIVNSLTKVCNFLDISAQRRKEVRLSIIPQVTQHQIWAGAIEETLKALKSDMDLVYKKGVDNMGQQIVVTCLKFLNTATSYDTESTSWMRPAPAKLKNSPGSQKWEDVLEMFNDLISCLRNEKVLASHLAKLEVMKEGLSQVKEVLIDKNIGYREIRYQEHLVSKKLSKTLGHSSPCLFTLLLYYLYGNVSDMEVELCGGVYGNDGGKNSCLYMGKILISDDERMVWSGVKQLDRALELFKLVWESSGMKEALELQGHLWCVGAENRSLTYKGYWIYDKISGLKKKYLNNVKKGQTVFSKPHEEKLYDFSEMIWGDVIEESGSKKKAGKKTVEKEILKIDSFPRLVASLESEASTYLLVTSIDAKEFAKDMVLKFEKKKAKELEEKWNEYSLMESQLYAKRLKIFGKQADEVLNVLKHSNLY